ncbi:MAG: glycine cleavage system protein H [Planctomycetaceae bacterium]|nr:glycine cleavage system protein H [Planctomycetaceae bacterium]
MPKPLVFMMGQSPAILPVDRRYARNHMWVIEMGETLRVGFSAYAVRLLGDMRHLEWSVEVGTEVLAGQQIGFVEASKATSDLYSPMPGRITSFNDSVLSDPGLINSNLYDSAWLMELQGVCDGLLDPEPYVRHLEASWPLAQRLLKGQAGRNPNQDPR